MSYEKDKIDSFVTSASLSTALAPYVTSASLSSAGSLAKAWASWNGNGTVALRAGQNVSSITDLGTGTYRVNFSVSFADTNYTAVASTNDNGNAYGAYTQGPGTTSAMDVNTSRPGTANYDQDYIYFAAFR